MKGEETNTDENPVVTQPKSQTEDIHKSAEGNDTGTKRIVDDGCLKKHNEIIVHQLLDVVEVLLGWQRNSRYQVLDKEGNQILYTYEVADCYARQCLGGLREFSMKATNDDGVEVLSIHRPLRCTSRCCWFCFNLQELEILNPSRAYVKEIWTCGTPTYKIMDESNEMMYTLTGDCCRCRCCANFSFQVINPNGEVVSTLTKIWGGCKDVIGAANDFSIEFDDTLDAQQRSIILGASFLVDFNYFEKHGRCW